MTTATEDLSSLLDAAVARREDAARAVDEAGHHSVDMRDAQQSDAKRARDDHHAAVRALDDAKTVEARVRAAIAVEALGPLVERCAELGAQAEAVFAEAGPLAARELDRAGIGSYRDLLGIVSAGFAGLTERGAAFVAQVARA